MHPGKIFFENFGHDTIVVADPLSGQSLSYNFGYFNPDENRFLSRLIRGQMMYYLVSLPLEEDLNQYQDTGRGITLQWLDLPPEQATALANTLAIRSQPEHARYRYDLIAANCATMLRDSLNQATGSTLKPQLTKQHSHGHTYRSEVIRLASPTPWMWLTLDLIMGPYTDQPLSRWEESFIPMRLAENLTQVYNSAGRPLVQDTQVIVPNHPTPISEEQPRQLWLWWVTGFSIAALILLSGTQHPRLIILLALPFWILCALSGLILIYFWGFSMHQATWANRNLLLLNPLSLPLITSSIAWLCGKTPRRWFDLILWINTASSLTALLAYWLPAYQQHNLPWIGLVLPIHLALAWTLHRHITTSTPHHT
ncbi:MAG TPA: lipoprotein N-acyltransferase Lnb domain-containing protein [Xylella sp.]